VVVDAGGSLLASTCLVMIGEVRRMLMVVLRESKESGYWVV